MAGSGIDLVQILPKTGVPVGQYGNASGAAFAAPYQEVERGGKELSQIATHHLAIVQQAEDAKKLLEIKTEAARVKSGHERYTREVENTLRETVTDPDEYYDKVLELGQAQIETALSGVTKHPEQVRAYLAPQLQHVLDQTAERASLHRIAKTKSATNARIDETVDNYTQLARQVPLTDQKAWAGYVGEIEAAIATGEPVNGRDATGDAMRKARTQLVTDRAATHMRDDPTGFQRDGAAFYGGLIGSAKLAELDEGAQKRITAKQNDEDRRARQLEAETNRKIKGLQDQTSIAFRQLYDRGALTNQMLDEAGAAGVITPEKFEHFSVLLKKDRDEPPFPPELLRQLGPQVYSMGPEGGDPEAYARQMQTRLMGLVKTGAIPYKGETEKWLAHLESRAVSEAGKKESRANRVESQIEREQNRQRSDAHYYHSQVEKQMVEDLRTRSPFEPLSQEAQGAHAQAMYELSQVSTAMGGSQDPRDWWQKNRIRYLAQVSDSAANRLASMKRDLGNYPTVESIVADRKRIGEERYYATMLKFIDVRKMEQEIWRMQDDIKRNPVKQQ